MSKPVVLPGTIGMGLATELTVTSKITTIPTGNKLTPTDVKLLRVNASNVVTSDLGTMRDDGTNGDTIAGDQIFTLKLRVTEPTLGEMLLRVRAGFQREGRSKQILSAVSAIPIVSANAAPVVNAGTDQTVASPATASLIGTARDDGLPSGSKLTSVWSKVTGPGTVDFSDTGALITTASFSTAGNYLLRLSVSDFDLIGTDEVTVVVNPANQPPSVSTISPAHGAIFTAPASITLTARASDSDGTVSKMEFFAGTTKLWEVTAVPYSFVWNNVVPGNYSLTARATDNQNGATTSNAVDIIVKASSGLPPDPASVAPPLDLSIATDMKTSTEFIYTGANPIQTGVTPGTIEVRRIAILRGHVLDRANAALAGVKISVLDHPEFGRTLSRADGAFDLAVNGGGLITVQYDKAGYLPASRQVRAPWRDYAHLDDVVLIPRDARVTTINLGATTTGMQVARSSVQTDADGARRATVLFPAGTTAGLMQPDGTTLPASTLNMRLTEYTVGPNGAQAMPANLPANSAYTYAVELGADEAVTKVNGRDVVFNQPVYFYVENFLNIPVGEIVPVGYYNNTRGIWMPSDNGRVLKVLGTTGGLADLDVDGDGVADSGAKLTALGVADAEREQLASLYAAGTSLWRAPLTHLSTRDLNWPYGCTTTDCDPPNPEAPNSDNPPDNSCGQRGSIIECESQVLGEAVGISGTPFKLNYRSDRTRGRSVAYSLRIPLSGASVRANLKRIELEVSVAGQRFVQTFPSAPNQQTSFTWDGNDAYGRRVIGRRPVEVRVGYVYNVVLLSGANLAQSFAVLGRPESLSPARNETTLWKDWRSSLGAWDARAQGLGGWTLDVHHAYDPAGGVLLLGDGSRRTTQSIPHIMSRFTLSRFCWGSCGDGGPAILAGLSVAQNIAVGPDGSVYIPSRDDSRLRRVGPDGIITTVAGTGRDGFSGDGGLATQAQLAGPEGVAVGPDGSLYIADTGNHRIRRVGLDGRISTVAGNGSAGGGGGVPRADGPATQVAVFAPTGIAVGPDGSLYIADQSIIRRVGTDGIITTFTGSTGRRCIRGPAPSCGDGGPAMQATISHSAGMAVAPDGALYIADMNDPSVRRVGPDGIITTVAGGSGLRGFSGDGDFATQAELNHPTSVSLGSDGSVYISDTNNQRIRRVSTDGVITTVVGGGPLCGAAACGYGGPATRARLAGSRLSAHVAPDGALIVWDQGNFGVVRVAPLLGGVTAGDHVIAAEDGSEVYVFSNSGRHLRTIHALTGAVLYQFTYDIAGRLKTVTDGDNNVTTIERNALGEPAAVVSPFGQRTTLTVDANGYLARVANPAAESFQFETTADGLLTKFTDPKGNRSQMTYDALGRLTRDTDAAVGFKGLARDDTNQSYTVSLSTALGRTTRYLMERLTTGAQRQVSQFPDGTRTEVLIGTDGGRKTTLADGTITNLLEGPDPLFSMQTPRLRSLSTSAGGLTFTLTTTSTAKLADPNNPQSLTEITDTVMVNGRTFTSVYDAAIRTATSTSATGRQGKTVIDALGRTAQSQVMGLLASNFTYDARGRLASITQGTGVDARAANLSYNAEGYLGTLTDPLGRTLTFTYNAAGRVTRQSLPDGRAIIYGYDANGNLTSLAPPGRPAHLFSYTSVNLQGEYTPPGVGAGSTSTRYTYNLDKQLTRITRPDGQLLEFGYDGAGRPGTLTLPTGQFGYTYNATTGKLAGITAPDGGVLAYTYNGALLTQTDWAGTVAGSVSRAYDNDFRVTSLSVNGTDAIDFQYDADGLLTRVGNLTLSRNAQNGLLTSATLGNVTDSLGYNDFGEVIAYDAAYSGSEVFKTLFSYDKLGRITTKTETVAGITAVFEYGYDLADRLKEVKKNGTITATYTYDSNGNRLTAPGLNTAANYDNQDRLTQYGGTTYSYTANGEMKTRTAGALVTSYDYDVLGNLKHVSLPGGTNIDYVVDGKNRRIGKKVGGILVQGFLYQDGLKPIAELDGSNNVVSRFVYATGVNVPNYMIKRGATYRILTDNLGSPKLVVDVATGIVVQRMEYDEFGRVLTDTNPGFQPFGFGGGLYDRDTKFVRFGARDYEAETGRWTAKDPILFAGRDLNLYTYTLNNPVNYTDRNGLGPNCSNNRASCDQNAADLNRLKCVCESLGGIFSLTRDVRDMEDLVGGKCDINTLSCGGTPATGFDANRPTDTESWKKYANGSCLPVFPDGGMPTPPSPELPTPLPPQTPWWQDPLKTLPGIRLLDPSNSLFPVDPSLKIF